MEPKQKNFTVWYFVAAAVALMLVQALVLAPHVETSPTASSSRSWPRVRSPIS